MVEKKADIQPRARQQEPRGYLAGVHLSSRHGTFWHLKLEGSRQVSDKCPLATFAMQMHLKQGIPGWLLSFHVLPNVTSQSWIALSAPSVTSLSPPERHFQERSAFAKHAKVAKKQEKNLHDLSSDNSMQIFCRGKRTVRWERHVLSSGFSPSCGNKALSQDHTF